MNVWNICIQQLRSFISSQRHMWTVLKQICLSKNPESHVLRQRSLYLREKKRIWLSSNSNRFKADFSLFSGMKHVHEKANKSQRMFIWNIITGDAIRAITTFTRICRKKKANTTTIRGWKCAINSSVAFGTTILIRCILLWLRNPTSIELYLPKLQLNIKSSYHNDVINLPEKNGGRNRRPVW